jgi:hypothetical protein
MHKRKGKMSNQVARILSHDPVKRFEQENHQHMSWKEKGLRIGRLSKKGEKERGQLTENDLEEGRATQVFIRNLGNQDKDKGGHVQPEEKQDGHQVIVLPLSEERCVREG